MTGRVNPSLEAGPGTGDRSRDEPVLSVKDLKTYLFTRWGTVRAVDGVSFDLYPGETLGVVGESGSGKSMLALSLMQLTPQPAARNMGGQIFLNGKDLLTLSDREMRSFRGRDISIILQDPHQSLNPVFSVGDQLREAISSHDRGIDRKTARERAIEALRLVRVSAPERRLKSYPHQLSGGIKQRVVGAMAMAYRPKVLIADEPTTALDVTIQSQYLRLLRQLQRETDVAIILITHDFGVVAATCDRVAVMYAGQIVEHGTVREIFDHPRHPYTRALLASRPRVDTDVDRLPSIEGQPPSMADMPVGCRFAPRCSYAIEICRIDPPPVFEASESHAAWCWRSKEQPWLQA